MRLLLKIVPIAVLVAMEFAGVAKAARPIVRPNVEMTTSAVRGSRRMDDSDEGEAQRAFPSIRFAHDQLVTRRTGAAACPHATLC